MTDDIRISETYVKARRNLVLSSGLLIVWEFVGITLSATTTIPGTEANLTVQHIEAIPVVLQLVVVFFLYRLLMEFWLQKSAYRTPGFALNVDVTSSVVIALTATTLFAFQQLTGLRVAEVFTPLVAVGFLGGLVFPALPAGLFGAGAGIALVTYDSSPSETSAIRWAKLVAMLVAMLVAFLLLATFFAAIIYALIYSTGPAFRVGFVVGLGFSAMVYLSAILHFRHQKRRRALVRGEPDTSVTLPYSVVEDQIARLKAHKELLELREWHDKEKNQEAKSQYT